MNRRKFITSSACAAATFVCSEWPALAQTPNQARPVSLRIDPQKTLGEIAPDFLGLGYEISSVARTGLLSAGNTAYVQYVKSLGRRGVIRIGGNTSDYSSYSKNGPPVSSPKATVVDDSVIRDLAGFLDATGWQLIWGLNLGSGNMENAIQEAQAVIDSTKNRLLAIEIGNEPDLFAGGVAHRPKGYAYSDYLREFRDYKTALRARFPNVPFAGPDVAGHTDWVAQFASDEGADVKLLTHHYYAEGPPQNPASTIEKLLQADDKLIHILDQCESASRQSNLPYRICETNSCFGGGKPGVSDTLASALWGLDFLFTIAAANSAGTNIETGVNQLGFISSYSPIGDDEQGHYTAKPIYYAMLAFAQASHGAKVAVEYDAAGMNLKAYGVKDPAGRLYITIINKEPLSDALISVAMPWQSGRGTVTRLTGPSLDSKTGVVLGGAAVSSDGKWSHAHQEHVPVRGGGCRIHLPAASAAILMAGK
jgi:hypothetical protein